MTVKKIYFDLDGVLADFDRGVEELCGLPRLNQEIEDIRELQMWDAIRQIPHFYDRLAPMPGAAEMFRQIYEAYGDRCEILTGVPKPSRGILTAEKDTVNWVRRELSPEIKINLVLKADKKDFCSGPDCILIDDFSRTIERWRTNGGTGIRFVSAEDTLRQLHALGVLPVRDGASPCE